jgi:hypothetical protein
VFPLQLDGLQPPAVLNGPGKAGRGGVLMVRGRDMLKLLGAS